MTGYLKRMSLLSVMLASLIGSDAALANVKVINIGADAEAFRLLVDLKPGTNRVRIRPISTGSRNSQAENVQSARKGQFHMQARNSRRWQRS